MASKISPQPDFNDYRGVIWVSGYCASGKTTVARILKHRLEKQGHSAILLDSDDMRSILAKKWGYDRADRVELSHIYMRLSSHLAAQGAIVILSVVSLYDEISSWFQTNIPRGLQIFLHVPEEVRRQRDALMKKVYPQGLDFSIMYDEPKQYAKYVDNFDVSPEEVADVILAAYLDGSVVENDLGRTEHWNTFYTEVGAVSLESSFARFANERLPSQAKLVEVGCGNGRDARFFARHGHTVLGIDMSAAAIEVCQRENCGSETYKSCQLSEIAALECGTYDAVYSRFVFHAMPLSEELSTLEAAAKVLKPGGQLFVECRSINDPMARLGEVISPTERIHGHYRRFLILRDFLERVESASFQVSFHTESNGLAVYKDEDPVVIRLVAQRVTRSS